MKSIEKGYMSFSGGMTYGMSVSKGSQNEFKQVDWAKAKEFIEANKDKLKSVSAGLAEDWSYTYGEVWNSEDGYIPRNETSVYACSHWATPSLEVEYKNGEDDTFECWTEGDDSNSYFEL